MRKRSSAAAIALLSCGLVAASISAASIHPHSRSPQPLSFTSDAPQIPALAIQNTATIAEFDFENNGAGDPQGWTPLDRHADDSNYFHVDDFSLMSAPYAPLSGSQSLWCGRRSDPCAAGGTYPGYGNYWRQFFMSRTFSVTGTVVITYMYRHDVELDYDFARLQYLGASGEWETLAEYTGTGSGVGYEVVSAGQHAGTIRFRFEVETDGIYSDGDGTYPTDGALVVDDIIVADDTGTLDSEDFEGEVPFSQSTDDGDWDIDDGVAWMFGNFGALVDGSSVLQLTTPDATHLWTFTNGSPDNFACAGYPSEPVVPYTDAPGSNNLDDYVYNSVRSPMIDISHDADGVPLAGLPDTLYFEFDYYRYHPLDALVMAEFEWRFALGPTCTTPWGGPTSLYYGSNPVWERFSYSIPVPEGATHVQLALNAIDMCFSWCGVYGDGDCHTNGPMYDNVTLRARRNFDFIVTSTNDSGPGSLRQALLDADADPDVSRIGFDIPGSPPYVIHSLSPLSASESVIIDATTQPGYTAGNPVVVVEGSSAGPGADGLQLHAWNSEVIGLVVGGFGGAGVAVFADYCVIRGCWIGLDAGGGADGNTNGVYLHTGADGAIVGGIESGDRNIISGNTSYGIFGELSSGNVIEGNYVGTDPSGSAAVPNFTGVGFTFSSSQVRIGGFDDGSGNVISGNTFNGIEFDNGCVAAIIHDNLIGWNAAGTAPIANGAAAIYLGDGCFNGTIGQPGRGNRISGGGILLHADSYGNIICSNEITGSDASGIDIDGSAHDNRIGGYPAAEWNTISGNASAGVAVHAGAGNDIQGNSIHSNGGLGIDLGPGGVTANDAGDLDTGANQLQNYPVLTSAFPRVAGTDIAGTLVSAPSTPYIIQFYASPACDASGYGEGVQYLDTIHVVTDPAGLAAINRTFPVVTPAGDYVTATATDPLGNTSEFAACVPANNTPPGVDVAVEPVDETTGTAPVTVTFDDVALAGATSLVTGPNGIWPPEGYTFGDPPSYYEIETTANYIGTIEVCVHYDEGAVGSETELVLYHWDDALSPPRWVDVTTSRDASGNTICGQTSHLSSFAIAWPGTPSNIEDDVPGSWALHPNVPNPFNPTTTIAYDVPRGGGTVSITIFDVGGRLVTTLVTGHREQGEHRVVWNGLDRSGRPAATGVYFCRMQAAGHVETRKMVLIK